MDSTADVTFDGAAAGDQFAKVTISPGDVNGDGNPDVLITADNNDAGGTDAGRAYLYYGGPHMDSTADIIFTGEAAGDHFGFFDSVAGSDVNGDGYPDILIGAYRNDGGGNNAGRVYVYYGGPLLLNNTADVILTGQATGEEFGQGIANIGDVDGDGNEDLIIGGSRNPTVGVDGGRAYIYILGGPRWILLLT